jgi:hypothetical protein
LLGLTMACPLPDGRPSGDDIMGIMDGRRWA